MLRFLLKSMEETVLWGLLFSITFELWAEVRPKPNVIIVFSDDQGYGDLGCYGAEQLQTPHLDRMAEGAVRMSDFYVPNSLCSQSRACLLTGKRNRNNGVRRVYAPGHEGMAPEQVTMAEALRARGYATALYGKWHLGDRRHTRPTAQGFEQWYGIPYSNDMYIGPAQRFAEDCHFREGMSLAVAKGQQKVSAQAMDVSWAERKRIISENGLKDRVPLMEGDEIVECPADQSTLTERYFSKAIERIKNRDRRPFFIMITPAMPHVPLYPNSSHAGGSEARVYGDVIEEIDHHMGRLLDTLVSEAIDEDTIVIYTSDNGPSLKHGEHGGSAKPLREGKATFYEGGVRVPALFSWPQQWARGVVCAEVTSTLDLMPTILKVTGQPASRALDGNDLSTTLEQGSKGALMGMILDGDRGVMGIRYGKWKYLPHGGYRNGHKVGRPAELYDLSEDIAEKKNLRDKYPELVQKLQKLIEDGDSKHDS
jgi:arylsulfatase A